LRQEAAADQIRKDIQTERDHDHAALTGLVKAGII